MDHNVNITIIVMEFYAEIMEHVHLLMQLILAPVRQVSIE